MFGHETKGILTPTMDLPKEYFQVNDLMYSADGFCPGTDDYAIENELHKISVVNERIERVNDAASAYNAAAKNLRRAGLFMLGVSAVSAMAIGTTAAIAALRAKGRKKKEDDDEAREAETR